MLEAYYEANGIHPSDTPPVTKLSSAYVQDAMERLERYGSLAFLEDIAKHGNSEEFYDLDDEFLVPDGDVETGTQEGFQKALDDGFYVLQFAELKIEPEESVVNTSEVVLAPKQSVNKTKSKDKQPILSTKVSRILAQIHILYNSAPNLTPISFPKASYKLLDSLGFQILREPVLTT
jgi:hypothetical protein